LLRHLRLSPAGDRAVAQGDPRRQHHLRVRDGGSGARDRPRDRPVLRRHQALRGWAWAWRSRALQDIRGQRAPRVSAARRTAQKIAAPLVCAGRCTPQRGALYTILPPTMVVTTRVLPMVSGGTEKMSCDSTARSASLPTSRVPTRPSEKAAG